MNKRRFVLAIYDDCTVPLNMSIKRHQAQVVIDPERGRERHISDNVTGCH